MRAVAYVPIYSAAKTDSLVDERKDSTPTDGMEQGKPQTIIGFHQDEHSDWVADLSCGHTQHVRHCPPWTLRPWVVQAEGRAQHLDTVLICKKCLQPE